MYLFEAVFLGIFQGLTEFFPVSSSGHLALMGHLFQLSGDPQSLLAFDILLHGGTLLALIVYYRSLWWEILCSPVTGDVHRRKLLPLLLLATIPGAVAGVLLNDFIAEQLRSPLFISIALFCTAIILILGEQSASWLASWWKGKMDNLTYFHALLIGCAQAFALVPGLSRSGLTISAGRALGLRRSEALDFSFLMAVPIMGGALAKTVIDAWQGAVVFPAVPLTLSGFAASFFTSLFAIAILRRWVAKYSLAWFGWYLIPVSLYLFMQSVGIREALAMEHVLTYVHRYGAIAIFLFAALESIPPISFVSPGALALVMAGSLIQGPMMAILFFLAAVAGVVLCNMLMFLLGKKFGRKIAHKFYLSEDKLKSAEEFMRRFGGVGIFFGQFINIVRPTIAFVAGTLHMPRSVYYSWMILSSLVWSGLLLSLGFMFRTHATVMISVLGIAGIVFIAGVAIAGAFATLRKRWKILRS